MREDSFRSQSKISCVWIPVVIAKSFSLSYNSLPGTPGTGKRFFESISVVVHIRETNEIGAFP